jgi:hypothetical protein
LKEADREIRHVFNNAKIVDPYDHNNGLATTGRFTNFKMFDVLKGKSQIEKYDKLNP